MPLTLLNVNFLFALGWADHIHHEPAHRWLDIQLHERWATCPMTQCGFVRISLNPKVCFAFTTPAGASELLEKIVAYPGHFFWPDNVAVHEIMGPGRLKIFGHLRIADAYPVGLAMRHGGQLATFEKRAYHAHDVVNRATGWRIATTHIPDLVRLLMPFWPEIPPDPAPED